MRNTADGWVDVQCSTWVVIREVIRTNFWYQVNARAHLGIITLCFSLMYANEQRGTHISTCAAVIIQREVTGTGEEQTRSHTEALI